MIGIGALLFFGGIIVALITFMAAVNSPIVATGQDKLIWSCGIATIAGGLLMVLGALF